MTGRIPRSRYFPKVRCTKKGRNNGLARDLVEATEGEIALGIADLGGLCVSLSWATPPAT